MALTRVACLNIEHLTQLDALCAECKKTDGNIIAIYRHLLSQQRPFPCNILYHRQQQLIGFLSPFFFYEDACEMTLLVSPASRRQGIATQMLRDSLPLLLAQGIKKLIFSSPADLNSRWLTVLGFCYEGCEYQMQRQQHAPITPNKSLLVRQATLTDLTALCTIDKACFPTSKSDMPIRLHTLLLDPSYQLFIAEKEGIPIGKVHIHWKKNRVDFSDIAILPPFQGLGFGSAMLAHCINYCLAAHQKNIHLNVATTNLQAINLYINLGFIVNNTYDFWSIPIDTLQRIGTYPRCK